MIYNKYIIKTADSTVIARKEYFTVLRKLFFSFLKIGAFTFGSGFTMIPIIQKETVDKHQWLDNKEILDTFALSESLPGSIAVNTAALVGYQVAGKAGAFFSALGVVIPSFCVIFILSFILKKTEHIQIVKYAFNGIRAGVLALIIKAMFEMAKHCPRNIPFYIISALAFAGVVLFGINIFLIIISSAAIGLTAACIADKKGVPK